MDNGDGCTTLWIYSTVLNCTLKNKAVNFMLYIFCHNKSSTL